MQLSMTGIGESSHREEHRCHRQSKAVATPSTLDVLQAAEPGMSDMQHLLSVLLPIIVLLALGVGAAIGSRAIGLSPVVGYICLGVCLNVWGLDLRPSSTTISVLAELVVLFLLFDIGLHFSFRQMRRQAGDIFGFGTAQVVLCAALLGCVGMLAGLDFAPAVLLGATLSLSSTAVVARLIAERHQQDCPVGLTATSILIFQDLAGIFILIVAGALDGGSAPLER